MPTKSEAVARFLSASTHPDLANLYSLAMECQVNVAQDGGKKVEGDFKSRRWHGWTDDLTTWKPFRIPYKANTVPEYQDTDISFSLEMHAEAIGMTGWDWLNRVSRWVAYDLDSIVGHSDKSPKRLSTEELEDIQRAVEKIPWVTIRASTSGNGLHLYVFVKPVMTANHVEHAALARSILGKLSALTGIEFASKVDVCGGNMWVWHRRMRGTTGLTCIKRGCELTDIPDNWKDHVRVIKGTHKQVVPAALIETPTADVFTQLVAQRNRHPLEEDHKKLLTYLESIEATWWWESDHNMLVSHTYFLKQAHTDLELKGPFDTKSPGTDLTDQNCFAFPLAGGAWIVRRYTQGVEECDTWFQDPQGWTTCYLNRVPDLRVAAKSCGGLEDPNGSYVFREAEVALKVLSSMGAHADLPLAVRGREAALKIHKDGRVLMTIEHKPSDRADEMVKWLPKKGFWLRMFDVNSQAINQEPEVASLDEYVRHLISSSAEDGGWVIRTETQWRQEPLAHIKMALTAKGVDLKTLNTLLGNSIINCWTLVNRPFKSEYPGNREWNKNAAQLRYTPTGDVENLNYPHWRKILQHCGAELTPTLLNLPWAVTNGITTGEDYLKCWIASLFKDPTEPLPYLFLYGPQDSGKSILHEALSLLMTTGQQRADAALINQTGFNGELEGAVLCIIEETDLRKSKIAYNRIKDWVTGREMLIHPKGLTPYHTANTTHWIQCANDHNACPIFPGDTRITMCWVPPLEITAMIPKRLLLQKLQAEAPDFLAAIMDLDIPASTDRLAIPALATEDKATMQSINATPLERFITDCVENAPGNRIKFSDFFDKFQKSLEPNEIVEWTKRRMGAELPPQYPKGRIREDGQFYIGNVCWRGTKVATQGRYVFVDPYIVLQ